MYKTLVLWKSSLTVYISIFYRHLKTSGLIWLASAHIMTAYNNTIFASTVVHGTELRFQNNLAFYCTRFLFLPVTGFTLNWAIKKELKIDSITQMSTELQHQLNKTIGLQWKLYSWTVAMNYSYLQVHSCFYTCKLWRARMWLTFCPSCLSSAVQICYWQNKPLLREMQTRNSLYSHTIHQFCLF